MDIIRLLPEFVSNQIAAGEVIQRPASAVKELLENAVDAGANTIKLIIREAGKSLIQVVDNGCGMSETDARMCFERHATSKIKATRDLLAIRTLGFRGEALASIASIAQVELITRKAEDEIGTSIQIHGSDLIGQHPVNCPEGTSVAVKNLFFNVPARRNFLKSNTLELKYIMEEFNRVAMVHPDISFLVYNQDRILFQLSPSNLKQRLIALLGAQSGQKLIPIQQESDLVNISGFIGKPEFAKKVRGEQYFFTNGRFIKSPYLNHAVENAFSDLIPKEAHPTYFIYLELDPQYIDINIHPTKTEINFQDAKSIYAILHASVKKSIGQFNLSPTLDFEQEASMNIPPPPSDRTIKQPTITINPDYNPFEKKTKPQAELPFSVKIRPDAEGWQKLYDPLKEIHPGVPFKPTQETDLPEDSTALFSSGDQLPEMIQIRNKFIVASASQGIFIIDQQRAHERIIYEKFLSFPSQQEGIAQRLLLPKTIHFTPDDAELFQSIADSLRELGYEISDFSHHSFLVHSIPIGTEHEDIQCLMEKILENFKTETPDLQQKKASTIAKALAKKLCVRRGQHLEPEEVAEIVQALFSCQHPEISTDGLPVMILLSDNDLTKKFKL